ncbi:MAG: hypothetical protein Q7S55_04300, partial [Nanoarchaeota archaeon]|nr:hypothetical protein [Nanoarchaeota archaeon]
MKNVKVMKTVLMVIFILLMLTSCTQQQPNLAKTSEENEPDNQNAEQPTPEPIEDTLTDDEGYDKEEELSVEERHWKRVFAKAFETVDCPEPRDPSSL